MLIAGRKGISVSLNRYSRDTLTTSPDHCPNARPDARDSAESVHHEEQSSPRAALGLRRHGDTLDREPTREVILRKPPAEGLTRMGLCAVTKTMRRRRISLPLCQTSRYVFIVFIVMTVTQINGYVYSDDGHR